MLLILVHSWGISLGDPVAGMNSKQPKYNHVFESWQRAVKESGMSVGVAVPPVRSADIANTLCLWGPSEWSRVQAFDAHPRERLLRFFPRVVTFVCFFLAEIARMWAVAKSDTTLASRGSTETRA